jgi:hypothetical protein
VADLCRGELCERVGNVWAVICSRSIGVCAVAMDVLPLHLLLKVSVDVLPVHLLLKVSVDVLRVHLLLK